MICTRKLGLALLVLSPGLASAADLPARTPVPVAPVANWGGLYAGSFFAGSSTRFASSTQGSSLAATHSGHSSGGLLGYNWQSGAYVFGLEGDLSQNYAKAENPGAGALVAHSARLLHSAHLRGRFGYDMGAFLPFAAAGASYGESAVSVPVSGDVKGATRSSTGWNIGAGVDWKLPLPIIGEAIVRAEYLYDRAPSRAYGYDAASPAIDMKSGSHQIRVALISTPKLREWRAPQMDAADWDGAYAGVLAGYGKNHVRTTSSSASTSLDADGGLGGFYGGRNFVFGNIVAGWDAATMLVSIRGAGVTPGTSDALHDRTYFASDIRGRAGYAFGRFLPFVAAGGAFARSEQSDQVTASRNVKVSSNAWTLGAGVDYMLMERVSARVEYLHQRSWKDADVTFNGVAMNQSRSSDFVRAGLAWHFH